MAKGDYILFNNVSSQTVTANSRRFGVMFNPNSSRSRFRIRDSGKRYAVRLRADGFVEYSIDGEVTWKRINPFADPCSNKQFPAFITHERLRTGEEINPVTFDMIAVGRGRIIGKEKGSDRLFHLYMDEMFRTRQALCLREEANAQPIDHAGDAPDVDDFRDPPIPPFNMKVDPEYFSDAPPSVVVPIEARRLYFNHPSSLRLPMFNELVQMQISDVMLVLERARTWYLKDTRSQLSIVAQEDLGFTDQDLIDVLTKEAIVDVLQSVRAAAEILTGRVLWKLVFDWLVNIDQIAQDWTAQIAAQGLGLLILPAYAGLGAFLYALGQSGTIKSEPGGTTLISPLKLIPYLTQSVGDPDAQSHIDDAMAKVSELLSQLMLRARRNALQAYGARPDVNRPNELPPEWTLETRLPTSNQPPSWMPVQVRTTYMRRKGAGKGAWKSFYDENERMQRVWAAINADGSLEAFGMGTSSKLLHTSQGKPNGAWDGAWAPLFTDDHTVKKLAYTRNIDGHLEIFRTDKDNRVFHSRQTTANQGSFNAWRELYSPTDKRISIAAEVNLDGRLEAFAVAEDGVVWRTAQTSFGTWSNRWILAGRETLILRDVWMARNADGILEVIAIANDNTLWHTSQNAPGGIWPQAWDRLYSANDHLAMLNIGRNANGTLEVIGVSDTDGSIWRTKQNSPGNWSGQWNQIFQPTDALSELSVTTNSQGWLELVGVSSNERVFHGWQTTPGGDFNSALQEIEARNGRRSVAVAPNVDGSIEILGIRHAVGFGPQTGWRMRIQAEKRFAIQYSQVLDIGIGSSHWAENWQAQFGGEIHALLAPRPLFQGERYSLIQYRFLNGPVIDGDAFNDGTTNFYMMVKLGPAGGNGAGYLQRYAILWFDEQTYFTQRYRLVHPTDDILGDLFSLPHYLRDNPDWYDFQLKKYWCPFRANLIDDTSRMVLRRNVIVVTGKDQGRDEIYTIVFNYGLCDHSWRWRLFPPAEHVVATADTAQDQDPQLPDVVRNGTASAYVAVNTIDIRDDTMLHVRGSQRSAANQPLRAGRWVQRYLPADCRHVPERHELDGTKPAAGFDHKWDFVTEDAYGRADRFYQFGVYENLIDSRGQYYKVELLPRDGSTPNVQDVAGRVWRNDARVDGDDRLRMNTINFNWALARDRSAAIIRRTKTDNPDEEWVHQFRDRSTISMYEPTTLFRILERKPLGLIAVFYDKRDDELQSVSNLPQPTTLTHDDTETQIPDKWKIAEGETIPPALPPPAFTNIRVRFKSNHRVLQPPNVRKAQVVIDPAPGLRLLHVSFWTPQTEQEVCENIWKVSLAAIDTNKVVFPIFSVTRFGNFVRRAVPDAPVPPNFTGDLGDAWRYDFDFAFTKETETNVRRFCTSEGHIQFGTSLWFEDIVGHRALAEQLIFA